MSEIDGFAHLPETSTPRYCERCHTVHEGFSKAALRAIVDAQARTLSDRIDCLAIESVLADIAAQHG